MLRRSLKAQIRISRDPGGVSTAPSLNASSSLGKALHFKRQDIVDLKEDSAVTVKTRLDDVLILHSIPKNEDIMKKLQWVHHAERLPKESLAETSGPVVQRVEEGVQP